ncbi:putative transmembrane protein [Parvularcula bermudensis HTCC2503]|uniref:Putative transmembrane protein n=1 Tax=Parvularcula bermudensis (strain ATCC BAA-594 / HTCC2503 / KCTC 12087) TaxID=314260 RepID=E0TFM7_PARBH|nr:nodulation protein NfeD [Parvularcula bermudensis]ADM10587.1 putative transmembrane protein [Parvularcula bermudensis HTCC2503]
MVGRRQHLWVASLIAGIVSLLLGIAVDAVGQPPSRQATLLTLKGPVTPAVAGYLVREMEEASDRADPLTIIEIDTPGGLVTSMKSIIKGILASETPVVTFVSPQGAQSASAGLYIMYAAHLSAMAPATNTGSATPIDFGGGSPLDPGMEDPAAPLPGSGDETAEGADPAKDTAPPDLSNEASLRGKIIEDSVAYIRSLAELRGRNADWAEKAVRPPSTSATAQEALALGVIDLVADDLDDLLRQLDGRTVETVAGPTTLDTGTLALSRKEPTVFERILSFVADPNVAAILLSIGTAGIIAEIWNPGAIFPGTLGFLSLLLALYAFQILPYNELFAVIMALGAFLVVVEMFTPTFGLAGAAGITLFAVGLWFLFPEELRIAPGILVGAVGGVVLILGAAFFAITASRSHGPLIGGEAIRKRSGRVDEWDIESGEGFVIVDGERWRARSKDPLAEGDAIKVAEIDGIVLVVRRAVSPKDRQTSRLGGRRRRGSPPSSPPSPSDLVQR